jgi:glycosyltransferase involved in cell wall biosynthesis
VDFSEAGGGCPMRVLFFTNVFPRQNAPHRGVFCMNLSKALVENGNELSVLSPVAFHEWQGASYPRNVHPLLPNTPVRHVRFFFPPRVLRKYYDAFMWWSVRSQLRAMLARFKPDCILSYWSHPDGAVAVRAARALGIRSGVIVGGSDILLIPRRDPARGKRIVETLNSADVVVTVSDHLRRAAIELGVRPAHIHAIHQGIDRGSFFPGDSRSARATLGLDPSARVLLLVGNLVPVKGIDVLLRACALLRNREFQVHILGSGPLRAGLESMAKSLGLESRVMFHGSAPQASLGDWYRAADLVVLSSHSEGIPNVLRESLACGTPFLATDVGGIREIAVPEMSRFVPPGNAEALAGAIGESLERPVPRRAVQFQSWRESAHALMETLNARRCEAAIDSAAPAGVLEAAGIK